MLLLAASLLLELLLPAAVPGQIINSLAGPFDVELRHIEDCPAAMAGLNLLNFTHRLTRDRKYPKRFYYTGVIFVNFDVQTSTKVAVRLSSWSSRGGWKENAYSHTFPHICELARTHASPEHKRHLAAALGRDFAINCPIPAARWEFVDFPVDVSTGDFKEFFYGKWRIDLQLMDGDTVLTCHREFVDTVPKVRTGRAPPEANFSGTLKYRRIKSQYPPQGRPAAAAGA